MVGEYEMDARWAVMKDMKWDTWMVVYWADLMA